MDNKFRPISNKKIKKALKLIDKELKEFNLTNNLFNNKNQLKENINLVIEEIITILNTESKKFIKEYNNYFYDLQFYRELLKEYPDFKDGLIITHIKGENGELLYYYNIPKNKMKIFKKVYKNIFRKIK